MPWPWTFCQACLDPVATYYASRTWFRWPFPQRDALYNSVFLEFMYLVWHAHDVLKRNPAGYDDWPPEDQALYMEHLALVAEGLSFGEEEDDGGA